MINMTLYQTARILHGKVYGKDLNFNAVATDTRKTIANCLFIALKGKRFDAHCFSEQAKNSGASALLVSKKLKTTLPQIVVKDTYLALNQLAAWVRQQLSVRVVALTGSSGKTSVKEMAAIILNQRGNTLYTTDNLNNNIGVPITLLRLTSKHKYAVIEFGSSHQGEIALATNITCPEVALVNNLFVAHLEGFRSLRNIAKAKGEIYAGLLINGIAIINADSNDWLNWKSIIGNRETWKFSLNFINSDFTATDIRIFSHSTKFTLHTPIGSTKVLLPIPGYHNVANALAATALSMAIGASLNNIETGFRNLKAIPGRLFPIILSKNKLLLDDSYNSNIGSMTAAIQVLSKMPGYRILVVSDMDELGDESKIYHLQIGKIGKEFNIDHVLSIGYFSQFISQESNIGEHFSDKISLIARLKELIIKQEIVTILVKGSRSAAMEEIVHVLQGSKTC